MSTNPFASTRELLNNLDPKHNTDSAEDSTEDDLPPLQITRDVDPSAESISRKIVAGDTHEIPTVYQMMRHNWDEIDLSKAFVVALGNMIGEFSREDNNYAGDVARREIYVKWLFALEGDNETRRNPFHGMHMWSTEVIRILLRDLWEDLVRMKWESDSDSKEEGEVENRVGNGVERRGEEKMKVDQ